jgi:hypothetical protein
VAAVSPVISTIAIVDLRLASANALEPDDTRHL